MKRILLMVVLVLFSATAWGNPLLIELEVMGNESSESYRASIEDDLAYELSLLPELEALFVISNHDLTIEPEAERLDEIAKDYNFHVLSININVQVLEFNGIAVVGIRTSPFILYLDDGNGVVVSHLESTSFTSYASESVLVGQIREYVKDFYRHEYPAIVTNYESRLQYLNTWTEETQE